MKWAITEKFTDYLLLNHFVVYTDNNPLTYILTSAKLDATGHRWASALAGFDFDIRYRAGTKNKDADAMSRLPYLDSSSHHEPDTYQNIEHATIKAICHVNTYLPYVDVIPTCSINIVEVTEDPGTPLAQIECREIRKQQRADPLIERWRRSVIDQYLPDRDQCYTRDDLFMRKHFDSLIMKRGILYRQCCTDQDTVINQLVLPRCYNQQVLQGLHNDIGHPGRDRTISLLKSDTSGLACPEKLRNGFRNVIGVYVGSHLPIPDLK